MQTKSEEISRYRTALLHGQTPSYRPLIEQTPGLAWQDFIITVSVNWFLSQQEHTIFVNKYERWAKDHHMLGRNTLQFSPTIKINAYNSSARAILWGTLIAATIAIRSKTQHAAAMQNTLHILLDHAQKLGQRYQEGWPPLQKQSGYFFPYMQGVTHLIQSILREETAVSELIFQANRDCCSHELTPASFLNQAFIDLCHYLLYEESLLYVQSNGLELAPESEQMGLINATGSTLTDLLKSRSSYTAIERHLICKRLNISIQSIEIGDDLETRLIHDQLTNTEPLFTLVLIKDSTHLLFDDSMARQFSLECFDRPLQDPVLRFPPNYQNIYRPQINPEKQLKKQRELFLKNWDTLLTTTYSSQFFTQFQQRCDFFYRNIREVEWQYNKIDVLFELEELIECWYIALSESAENANMIACMKHALAQIYAGNVPLLPNIPHHLNAIAYIGGQKDCKVSCQWSLSITNLSPQEHQAISVIIAGINRTEIHLINNNFHANLKKYSQYIYHLKTKQCLTQKHLIPLKACLISLFQIELDNAQNRTPYHKEGTAFSDAELEQCYILLCHTLDSMELPGVFNNPPLRWVKKSPPEVFTLQNPSPREPRVHRRRPITPSPITPPSPVLSVRVNIPDEIYLELQHLKRLYREDRSLLKITKYNFFMALEARLNAHPEQTYTACVESVTRGNEAYMRAIGKNGYFGGGFFGKHRTYDLVKKLKRLDDLDDSNTKTY